MILLDASVIIAYLRRRERWLGAALTALDLGVCGVTRAEVLHGAKTDSDDQNLRILLGGFRSVSISDEAWDGVGKHLRDLRRHGVIVPFTDAVIATLAIMHSYELWAFDAHYQMMASILPLKLYRHPDQPANTPPTA